ncbi:Arachidonate 15-lipoxygenase [Sciurus carolinensis]|uniref:Arachidonate 15-lipoxygenase n=1 Tax=Sciurus carolinensis TaxID=30640 RepID=A0AA41T4X9_SCICA|nr:Arachidonate 15-lipoxygenase [Sciurus carolinensis]
MRLEALDWSPCSSSPLPASGPSPGVLGGQKELSFFEDIHSTVLIKDIELASEVCSGPQKTDLEIDVPLHLGRLLLVKLRKHKDLLNFDWFCKWITVQGPGTQGRSVSDEPQNLFKEYREQELEDRRKVVLGQHREKYLSGPGPQAVLKQFQEELADMDRDIKVQHAGLDLPYEYLQPSMSVQGPGDGGAEYRFLCYGWVQSSCILSLPEGTGCTVFEDSQGLIKKHREEELEERRKITMWGNWKTGLILNVTGTSLSGLPANEPFLENKRVDFEASLAMGLTDQAVKRSVNILSNWNDVDDFNWIFWCGYSKLAVWQSWKEDIIFGYQFLNGANPMLLRHSIQLPDHLVFPPGIEALKAQLQKELKGGSLFEADFYLMDGIKANVICSHQQHLVAPLVMLKLQSNGQVLPMAIQVRGLGISASNC